VVYEFGVSVSGYYQYECVKIFFEVWVSGFCLFLGRCFGFCLWFGVCLGSVMRTFYVAVSDV